jgi:hypothetical protein
MGGCALARGLGRPAFQGVEPTEKPPGGGTPGALAGRAIGGYAVRRMPQVAFHSHCMRGAEEGENRRQKPDRCTP